MSDDEPIDEADGKRDAPAGPVASHIDNVRQGMATGEYLLHWFPVNYMQKMHLGNGIKLVADQKNRRGVQPVLFRVDFDKALELLEHPDVAVRRGPSVPGQATPADPRKKVRHAEKVHKAMSSAAKKREAEKRKRLAAERKAAVAEHKAKKKAQADAKKAAS